MNKKLVLIVLSLLIIFGLSVAIYQYSKEFQAEFASATGTKPSNGHLWSEMECDGSGLCVDSTNGRVGIGNPSPANKLDVTGSSNFNGAITTSSTITAAGDVCGAGACLSQIAGFVGTQYLALAAHTFNMCTTTTDSSGYGETVNIGTTANPVYVCKFDAATCPAGQNGQTAWKQYDHYGATGSGCWCWDSSGGCNVIGHSWANSATMESCTYTCYSDVAPFVSAPKTCTGTFVQIGCY